MILGRRPCQGRAGRDMRKAGDGPAAPVARTGAMRRPGSEGRFGGAGAAGIRRKRRRGAIKRNGVGPSSGPAPRCRDAAGALPARPVMQGEHASQRPAAQGER